MERTTRYKMERGQDIKWREDKVSNGERTRYISCPLLHFISCPISILYLVLSPFYILSYLHLISCPLSILYLVLSPFYQDIKWREDKVSNGERTRYKMEIGQDIKWRREKDIKWR
jgi:hypothetical protein